MNKLYVIKGICSFLPPIISQKIRAKLISIKEAEKIALQFKRKSFTGSYLKGNTNDFHAFKFFIHGYFDWRNIVLTRKILQFRKGDVVEVGANIGTETISLVDVAKPNKVHAFEPVPSNYKSILEAKEYNQLDKLLLYNVLVSNEPGKAQFKVPTKNNSGSGFIATQNIEDTQEFEVVTLDDTLKDNNVFSAILVDVEGFEYNVLAGATRIIEKDKPFLILEVNAKYLEKRANISVSFLYDELENMGYESYYIGKIGLKKVNIRDFKTKANKNWVCIPKKDIHYKNKLSKAVFINAFNPFMSFKIL